MQSDKTIIELRDLSKVYQMGEDISVTALDHVNIPNFSSQDQHVLINSSSGPYPLFSPAK
jgi:hypothetical protein